MTIAFLFNSNPRFFVLRLKELLTGGSRIKNEHTCNRILRETIYTSHYNLPKFPIHPMIFALTLSSLPLYISPISSLSVFIFLDFPLGTFHKLSSRTTNSQFARFLDFSLENHLVAFFPHLSHERLARQHGAGETDLDVLIRAESICSE